MRRLEFEAAKEAAVAQATDLGKYTPEESMELQQAIFEALISSQASDFGLSREETLDGFIRCSISRGYFPQFSKSFSLLPLIGA